VSGDGDGGLAACCAGTSNTLIRVVGFGTDTTVTLDVGKGIVHETTVATLVAFGVAGDKHLFGKGHEFAGGDGVSTFGRTGGGKGPAGTALALVFNGCDGVLFGPINGRWGRVFDGLGRQSVVDVLGTAKVLVSIFDPRVDLGKIFPRHIGEFVVADFGRVTFGVVLLDEGVVGGPGGVGGVNLSIGVLFVEEFGP